MALLTKETARQLARSLEIRFRSGMIRSKQKPKPETTSDETQKKPEPAASVD